MIRAYDSSRCPDVSYLFLLFRREYYNQVSRLTINKKKLFGLS